ncbi:PIN domain-containing protein [Salipiger sp. PrR002]|uniref:PIN domain-containing protein n=1 Tax=Salipiger sp. PrR002 TaxID=2706489 RepID=UPI0013B7559F|nr:PIN domain-containing protein [Salipiger sp. PrR002]NDW00465.1 PIN domain-containing protein [Salipiger sp. PrR002]NDW56423.1 PIN domain-containing protein [Salipiger sp. PrR004]
MAQSFFDTNVILYLLGEGPKADRAEALLAQGGVISVQVLNEALVNCRRKAKMSHEEAGEFLGAIRALCDTRPLTEGTHDIGRALGARYGFSVYDSMIVAAALEAGCETLWSEDMHDGLLVEGCLRIVNPFRPG